MPVYSPRGLPKNSVKKYVISTSLSGICGWGARRNLEHFTLHAFNTCLISFLLAPAQSLPGSFEMTSVMDHDPGQICGIARGCLLFSGMLNRVRIQVTRLNRRGLLKVGVISRLKLIEWFIVPNPQCYNYTMPNH